MGCGSRDSAGSTDSLQVMLRIYGEKRWVSPRYVDICLCYSCMFTPLSWTNFRRGTVYVCVCIYICMYTYTHISTYIHTYVCIYIYICVCILIRIHAYMYMFAYACLSLSIYIYTYIYIRGFHWRVFKLKVRTFMMIRWVVYERLAWDPMLKESD